MADNHQKSIVGIVLVILIIVGDLITGVATSHVASPNDRQWTTYPSASYSNGSVPSVGYNPCTVANLSVNPPNGTSSVNGDFCELFSSRNYRAIAPQFGLPATVDFSLNCISPVTATLGGSVVYLQYANYTYSAVPGLWENTSAWVLVGSAIYIDASNPGGNGVWDCPGELHSSATGNLPNLPSLPGPNGWIFRVVAVCCAAGETITQFPILNNIQVDVHYTLTEHFTLTTRTLSTSSFSYQANAIPFSVTTNTNVNIQWIATNSTNGTCGIVIGVLDSCLESGSTSNICTITAGTNTCNSSTVTFPRAFTGTVHITMTVSVLSGFTKLISTSYTIFSS